MVLINNHTILRRNYPAVAIQLEALETMQRTGNVLVEPSKQQALTLKIMRNGNTQYVHSKYDPVKEAKHFIERLTIDEAYHVLFIGIGLGYHIEAFTHAYPHVTFSIYEPDTEILLTYLSHRPLNAISDNNLYRLFTDNSSISVDQEIQQLSEQTKGKVKIITLPVYEKLYRTEISSFTQKMVSALKKTSNALIVDMAYQKRWSLNAIKNFSTVFNTPNLLQDVDTTLFAGKPAILIAAGPSLNEEFEHLRYIKDNGLAYLFAVGSAINALIEQGIYPDATCTYDPQKMNYKVIQKINDQQLANIPLVFGSTVGFETIEQYPGKMFHILLSQDLIAPLLLKHQKTNRLEIVSDAPSIAIVMLQALCRLGFGSIILVGQNLAYVGNDYYATGIDATRYAADVEQYSFTNKITVKDVHGNDIQTTEGYNLMRQQFEQYIAHYPHPPIINTTAGGAAIEGTTYIPLSQVISHQFTTPVVCSEWLQSTSHYDCSYVTSQLNNLTTHQHSLHILLSATQQTLETIQQKPILFTEKEGIELQNKFETIQNNPLYKHFIAPMFRVQFEHLTTTIQSLQQQPKTMSTIQKMITQFNTLFHLSKEHYDLTVELFEEMKQRIAQH